ncbi:MAG: ergothioneine biosynthesis protein EgtB [Gammaproteobacteria bacterium]
MNSFPRPRTIPVADSLASRYQQVRAVSVDLCRTLAPEDMVVQSMPDASPAKWHLAHTTWFFEQFLLKTHLRSYRPFNPAFDYLFNSYYYTVGAMHSRQQRGLLSRPTVVEVMAYRDHVDANMARLLEQQNTDAKLGFLVALGLNHEQQHQELLLTDIKHLLSCNPLKPAWCELPALAAAPASPLKFISRSEGLFSIGHAGGGGFAFDNETPRHRVFLPRHAIASRLVTNGEYREFIHSGGYDTPELWLSDGWATVQKEGWNRPLYWNEDMSAEFTLGGERQLDPNTPVCHVSYYEADAFARWAGARLPTEAEWEILAVEQPIRGNFMESGLFHPRAAEQNVPQLYGDVWEWTASAYLAYPGFKPLAGSLGEYNGKFMVNQMVLRGGSCVTPADHIRASYRNFFYPPQRWQFMGLRLARDE